MAHRAGGRGSSHGIHGAILATGLGGTGTVLEANLPEAGRRRPEIGNATSGASTIESRATRAQEGFPRCRTSGEAAGSKRADPKFCARCRTASLANGDAQKVSADTQSSAATEPTGGSAGRSPYQIVQSGLGSAGRQCAAHAEGAGGWRNQPGSSSRYGR